MTSDKTERLKKEIEKMITVEQKLALMKNRLATLMENGKQRIIFSHSNGDIINDEII